jgi:hypothetical protein
MARQFHVAGTQVYQQVGIGLLVLGLWCVKDGWLPSRTTLDKHPLHNDAGDLDHYYIFNRSLAVLCLLGAGGCGYVHRIVK